MDEKDYQILANIKRELEFEVEKLQGVSNLLSFSKGMSEDQIKAVQYNSFSSSLNLKNVLDGINSMMNKKQGESK